VSPVTLVDAVGESPPRGADVIALDSALTRLATIYPEQGRLVELRFFGGLTIEETGEAMGISPATVKRQWMVARAWLLRELKGEATLCRLRPGPISRRSFMRRSRVPRASGRRFSRSGAPAVPISKLKWRGCFERTMRRTVRVEASPCHRRLA
jgi:hypothetical protein